MFFLEWPRLLTRRGFQFLHDRHTKLLARQSSGADGRGLTAIAPPPPIMAAAEQNYKQFLHTFCGKKKLQPVYTYEEEEETGFYCEVRATLSREALLYLCSSEPIVWPNTSLKISIQLLS